jgi:hypothetical protein
MFSRKGVHLYCVWDGGFPRDHITNRYWYADNDNVKHAHREFTFLVWKKEDEIPDFFKASNPAVQFVEIEDWRFYQVKPYRCQSDLHLVLIDTSSLLEK